MKKPPTPSPSLPSALTRFQRFTYREIPRSSIKLAEYNPRRISAYSRALLKKKLEEVGCVEPLVWNERTSTLVSGHQRLSILDELEGRPDYLVAVAVVNLSPKREREMNVFLNNTQAQGFYDKDGFFSLLNDPNLSISLPDIGFTKADLELQFGEIPTAILPTGSLSVDKETRDVLDEQVEAMAKDKAAYLKEDKSLLNEDSTYIVVMYEDRASRDLFLKNAGIDIAQQYIPYAAFAAAVEQATTSPQPQPQPQPQPSSSSLPVKKRSTKRAKGN